MVRLPDVGAASEESTGITDERHGQPKRGRPYQNPSGLNHEFPEFKKKVENKNAAEVSLRGA